MSAVVKEKLGATGFGVTTPFQAGKRLSPETRALAARYLSGEIGRAVKPAAFALDSAFLRQSPTPSQQYAEAVRRIATKAPLRILSGENLVGAATLQEAMQHRMPLTDFASISHTTLGFEKALQIGYCGIREEIRERLSQGGLDDEGTDLLAAMQVCLDAAGIWHSRYCAALETLTAEAEGEEQQHYRKVLGSLRRVPEHPPQTFREAVQSLWLLWEFQRLCGNWSGIGRIDKMLGPFLKNDLKVGRITLSEARELIAHFWIKGCEWITAEGRGTGDAQFYQNIILGGVDEEGKPLVNEVTDLVLDVVEELHISDFPIAVRLSSHSSKCLLDRVAAIQRLGGGIIAIYNDDLIIPSLVKFGYPLEEARNYTNDGCWEILIPGKTSFGYQPFDALLLLQQTLGLTAAECPPRKEKIECSDWVAHEPLNGRLEKFADFDALYSDFRQRLETTVDSLTDNRPFSDLPCPLLSLLVDGCIERGRSYCNGGPVYTVRSPHAGGLPDVANSLLAVRRLVYEEKEISLPELVKILRADWEGEEVLRQKILSQFDFYGNDNQEADALMQQIYNDFTGIVGRERERHGVLRPAGISTFGREVSNYLPHREATASGRRKGAILAANFSASPGTDRRGPTAVIRSHCSVDFSRLPCGTALDLKLSPTSVRGETGIQALTALMQTFIRLGGIFMQIDVVDSELLRDAQAHPENYPNLSVRISGWSARFATLSEEWQEMIITRTEQNHGC